MPLFVKLTIIIFIISIIAAFAGNWLFNIIEYRFKHRKRKCNNCGLLIDRSKAALNLRNLVLCSPECFADYIRTRVQQIKEE